MLSLLGGISPLLAYGIATAAIFGSIAMYGHTQKSEGRTVERAACELRVASIRKGIDDDHAKRVRDALAAGEAAVRDFPMVPAGSGNPGGNRPAGDPAADRLRELCRRSASCRDRQG